MSIKNSIDTIGNRTRDLPICSAVPQLTALPRAPNFFKYRIKILSGDFNAKIKTSAKESLGLHELKQHKTQFDEECSGFRSKESD